MTINKFLEVLRTNPNLPLLFEYQDGKYARPDYHITEVKNVSYDTVDCGGIRNQWTETIVQLWENEMPELNHSVDTTKALKIFDVVERVRPTFGEVELKFEYGNANFHTAIMQVKEIVVSDKIEVKLLSEHTTCKAKDRAATVEEKNAACCTPGGGCC